MVFDTLFGMDTRVPHPAADGRWRFRVEDDRRRLGPDFARWACCSTMANRSWRATASPLSGAGPRATASAGLLLKTTDELSAPDDRTIPLPPQEAVPDAALCVGENLHPDVRDDAGAPGENVDPFKQITELVGSGPFRFKADERVSGFPGRSTSASTAISRARTARRGLDRRPEDRCPSTVSSGRPFPTKAPPPARCRPVRSTGGKSPPTTLLIGAAECRTCPGLEIKDPHRGDRLPEDELPAAAVRQVRPIRRALLWCVQPG